MKYFDLVIRTVPNSGFLPIIVDDSNNELYRGEFRDTPHKAFTAALDRAIADGLLNDEGSLKNEQAQH